MTILHKRILYLVFFVLFFILAPIVLMYAQGYKLDWGRKKMVKTGVIFLETKPSKAKIYLDDELYDENTTVRIQRLLPGEYEVKLVKEGYRSWQKKLTIYPNSTTYAQYIRLFKQNPDINQLFKGQITYAKYSTDGSLIALITTQAKTLYLNIYNLLNQQIMDQVVLAREDYVVADIKWNLDSNKLIVRLAQSTNNQALTNKTFLLYDLAVHGEIKNLNFEIKQNPLIVNFCEFNKNLFYFYIEDRWGNGQFKKYNLLLKENKKITDVKLLDFYFDGNNIYYINSEKSSNLNFFSLAEPEEHSLIANLPMGQDYKIIDIHNNLLTIHSMDTDKLYLIKLGKSGEAEAINIIHNAKGVVWHTDKHLLTWWNDFELWSWEVENPGAKKELLTRISSVIDDVFWYPVETHLAYSTYNKIRIIELISHSGVRETTDIFTAQQLGNPILNSKGDKIYFTGKAGKDEGLFELTIQ